MAHFEVVSDYGSGDLSDQKTIDAICMRLSAGIEALSGLSAADREALFGDVWSQMWGMRNRIAHGYLLVEPAIVRSTVDRDLPVMVEAVRAAIDRSSLALRHAAGAATVGPRIGPKIRFWCRYRNDAPDADLSRYKALELRKRRPWCRNKASRFAPIRAPRVPTDQEVWGSNPFGRALC
ncbi:hypothetical protein GCM10023153_12830 [Ornithinibacter aureus]|uniref:DUF86 domain-containing protein n=1 Tax=Ornithinibacter aureus TaxID=622664 RepID=A0ABP8JME8_9MICO|nr:HepT-like ribonuclease domain-containing protein [Ornithinibacter aureus]KAF0834718.1 uncharacterized protein DUF86 [Ornithinibacter aureus]